MLKVCQHFVNLHTSVNGVFFAWQWLMAGFKWQFGFVITLNTLKSSQIITQICDQLWVYLLGIWPVTQANSASYPLLDGSWVPAMGHYQCCLTGKVTVGLVLQRPCLTDSVTYPPVIWMTLEGRWVSRRSVTGKPSFVYACEVIVDHTFIKILTKWR